MLVHKSPANRALICIEILTFADDEAKSLDLAAFDRPIELHDELVLKQIELLRPGGGAACDCDNAVTLAHRVGVTCDAGAEGIGPHPLDLTERGLRCRLHPDRSNKVAERAWLGASVHAASDSVAELSARPSRIAMSRRPSTSGK